MKRISAIADWIEGPVIADIGADHALLCIEALQKGKAQKAYAIDISEKPLVKAKENIEKANLAGQITTRIANGLEHLEQDVSQIIMAGLGAGTMIEILEKNPVKLPLLLSPHKDVIELRAWLCTHGYKIIKEKMIEEGHFYPLLQIRPSESRQKLSQEELFCGVQTVPDQDYLSFLLHEINLWKKRYPRLSLEKKEEIQNYLKHLETRLEKTEKLLKEKKTPEQDP